MGNNECSYALIQENEIDKSSNGKLFKQPGLVTWFCMHTCLPEGSKIIQMADVQGRVPLDGTDSIP